jgi:gamma-glutamyltranspeptidase
MTLEDFAEYASEIEDMPSVSFQDVDVPGCGAWSQGPAVLRSGR